ncbi:hypothetical protein [Saccharothrix saharensis]|uniref:hypothetical protein n=1 Tax=Saccharothrix saharensis TaxID=571190 RepID=UPI0011510219|nr:hypothetical protein [Saccharothrix saharensis]
MPSGVDPVRTARPPVTAREDRGVPGEARVCPILRTVLDANRRDRAEVRLDLLARLAASAHG